MWRQEQCGLQTTIQNLNITVPVIDLAPTCTPTSLNAAILCKLDITLHGLHRKAGVPNHSRIILNNVNMTTIILAAERKASLAPDTSLLDRVQRIPTGPRSNIGSYKAHLHPVGIHPVSIRSFSIFPTCVWSHCVFSADLYTQQLHRHDSNLAPSHPDFYGFEMLSCLPVPSKNSVESNYMREAYESEIYVYRFVLPLSCYSSARMNRCLIYFASIS
ncbi:uncharacterized protein N7487_009440 [Penicillium crustosum]|uniref:uncharacterized protein n=1 Tax=Penicillium crustosum TaxID=36656 RepID=UPI00239D8A36|nr:uncharacterized protein N7487_009440 [Penicillium crustosum]KAJ5395137.1 hypothetical protein N7487_009440 [Penicillium crustosum]